MKNSECVIYIINKKGDKVQTYRKDKDTWTQTTRKGTVRTCTAEQLLSHILPPLAGVSSFKVVVERTTQTRM